MGIPIATAALTISTIQLQCASANQSAIIRLTRHNSKLKFCSRQFHWPDIESKKDIGNNISGFFYNKPLNQLWPWIAPYTRLYPLGPVTLSVDRHFDAL